MAYIDNIIFSERVPLYCYPQEVARLQLNLNKLVDIGPAFAESPHDGIVLQIRLDIGHNQRRGR